MSLSIPPADNPAAQYRPLNDRHSRSSSLNSHTLSVQSAANSTRYMLAGMNNNSTGLEPPNAFASRSSSFARSTDPKPDVSLSSSDNRRTSIPTSLSVNYLPSKFSNTMLAGGIKRRKGKGMDDLHIPKRGGGREAFRANESRMPGDGDDDYDGVNFGQQKGRKGRLRWNRFKWVLFVANTIVRLFTFFQILRYACGNRRPQTPAVVEAAYPSLAQARAKIILAMKRLSAAHRLGNWRFSIFTL